MKANVEGKDSRADWPKWIVVATIIALAVWGNFRFAAEPLLYRVLALAALAVVAAGIALWTTQGVAFRDLAIAARTEIRKVVWPTRQETTQTTMIVVAVVVIMALLLWGLDTLLGWLASKLIG
jgi:preprotein translocase subunit SecE